VEDLQPIKICLCKSSLGNYEKEIIKLKGEFYMNAMTVQNLRSAFGGESQAHMRYLIWADKAEKEGFPNVGRLFRAISFAEQVHATRPLYERTRVREPLVYQLFCQGHTLGSYAPERYPLKASKREARSKMRPLGSVREEDLDRPMVEAQ